MDQTASPVQVRAWRPRVPGIREALHARFLEHAYPPHAHDTWTLFLVDSGGVRYDLGRHQRVASRAMISALPPHVAHDGRPAGAGGYAMRVLYVERSVLPDSLIGLAVDRPFIEDLTLRRRLEAVHRALDAPGGELEAETRLHLVADRIGAILAATRVADPAGRGRRELGEAVRAALDADLFEPVSIATIAAGLHVSPTAAARAFAAAFGIAPHAYVLGRRVEEARVRILDGMPLADVAAATGFADQAHLTHRFRRLAGVTPGRYAGGGQRRHPAWDPPSPARVGAHGPFIGPSRSK